MRRHDVAEQDHPTEAVRAVLEWLLFQVVKGADDPQKMLADFQAHMEDRAKQVEGVADALLSQNKVDAYIAAMDAAARIREVAVEVAPAVSST